MVSILTLIAAWCASSSSTPDSINQCRKELLECVNLPLTGGEEVYRLEEFYRINYDTKLYECMKNKKLK